MPDSSNKKILALVDCNSFYCSCERLFRPDLKNIPVGVLSNNDGCFVSRTNELKKLGVPMGAPYFQFKKICDQNKVAVFSANFSLYTNISDRVMNTLFEFAPSLEIYSVDEAFLDLTGFDESTIEDYCQKIKATVERNTGIPVGIGIGRTKVLAKLSNRMAKKNEEYKGVYNSLTKEKREHALNTVAIEDVWGIGRQNALKMRTLGIKKAQDLVRFQNTALIQKIFTKVGRMIQDELREISCFPFNELPEKKKEIMCSRSFGNPVYDLSLLQESVASYATLAAEKLRKQNSVCQEVEVYIRTNPFNDNPQYVKVKSKILDAPTLDSRKIIKAALEILDDIFLYGFEYKKAMVRLCKIQDANEFQPSLFSKNNDSKNDISLMKTMDQINHKEGHETLKVLACGTNKSAWYMKQIKKSPRYTTGFRELKKIQ